MGCFVREFKSDSGESRAVLIDDRGSPFFWPNVYVVSDYLNTGKSPNTISKLLRVLSMAHKWASSHGFDFDQALSVGNLISIDQAESVAHFLRLNAKAQADEIQRREKFKADAKVIHINPGQQKAKNYETVAVSASEAAIRIQWVIKYIKWHLDRRLGSLDRAKKESELVKTVGMTVISRLQALTPKMKQGSVDEERLEGVSVEICEIVENIFKPGSPANPFTLGFIQERNYLIWRFFFETGMRREELQSLLVEKIDYSLKRVQITKSKTLKRTVPISEMLALRFHSFILNYWSRIPPKLRKHGYLFTTRTGRHLGLNSINLIFRTVRKCDDRIPDFLAPHVVRRTWNERFEEKIEAEQEKSGKHINNQAIQNRLQGWSDNSQMGARYGKGQIRKKADKIAEKLASELTGKKS